MKGGMKVKLVMVVGLLLATDISRLKVAEGSSRASPCGKSSPDSVAVKLSPCITAARNAGANVPRNCCRRLAQIGKRPDCLCAAFLSPTARSAGVDPRIAFTIPRRCNIARRPVGYKCGPYRLP